MFAIPPPLPRPAPDLSSTAIFNSDTATLPHPIYQSITTPQSSRARGDWGFKRPLPLRATTKTSTPIIRVESVDTLEHITEFGSAADHSLTLLKWQEMDVHLSTPPPPSSKSTFGATDLDRRGEKSVFEDAIDSTTTSEGGSITKEDARWKFSGPWLAGLNEGAFNEYIKKEVRKKKLDFNKYLRTACAEALTKENQRAALEEEGGVGETVQASDITDEQLSKYIKSLREDRTELYRHIRRFLDLPPAPNPSLPLGEAWISNMLGGPRASSTPPINPKDYQPTSESPYADSGPPRTHPSAGLSYGRTSAHTFNHPLYGPQNKKPPVQARVVMPKGAATGNFAPLLGVGGFVVDVPAGEASFNVRTKNRPGLEPLTPGLQNIEPHKVGGSKAYVHPKSASVDPKGRIILKVEQADPEAVAVLEGKVDEIPRQELLYSKGLSTKPPARSSEGYGLSSSDFGKMADPARKL